MNSLKNIILWSYARASWQWDLLCILIVLFIFLTPKSWFDKKDDLQPKPASSASKPVNFRPDENSRQQ